MSAPTLRDLVTVRHRAARALLRIATGAFLAWFIAVSVLATTAAASIATFLASADAQAMAANDGSEDGSAGGGAEEAPVDDGATDPMAPPGDDVPPEVEVDLEHEPWDVCATLDIPPPSGELIDFDHASDWRPGVPGEAASPPPRI
jgi:hypothetical protein